MEKVQSILWVFEDKDSYVFIYAKNIVEAIQKFLQCCQNGEGQKYLNTVDKLIIRKKEKGFNYLGTIYEGVLEEESS